ncbi:hypothetical protein OCS65_18275 [Rhodococcus aetherivorans]|uniref:Lipoprotein n=1 Tax=Rhodococcus aetherivorans TaxID=191292 RepID=A0AA46PD12_9NOCA|nr:hypothetical protein [Rhodococcus aetherivorans]UYF92427.1 hypothetical protein OCS65_18275 [Rhodococcus aetherivorans]
MRLRGAMFAPALLVVAACGFGGSEPSEPEKLSGMQEYESIEAMVDDFGERGLNCDITMDKNTRYATEAGRCQMLDTEMVLSIFSDTRQMDNQRGTNQLLASAGIDYGLLIGANWTVNCGSEADCEAVKAKIGGRIEAG